MMVNAMLCEKTVAQLWNQLDDPSSSLEADCSAHLSECEGCQAAQQEVQVVLHALARHETFRAPAGFAESVMAGIGAMQQERTAAHRSGLVLIGALAVVASLILWIAVGPTSLSQAVSASGGEIAEHTGYAKSWLATQWNTLSQSLVESFEPFRPVGRFITPVAAMVIGCAIGGMSILVLLSLGAMRRRTAQARIAGSVLL